MKTALIAFAAVFLFCAVTPDAQAFRFRRRAVNVNVLGGGFAPAVNVQVARRGLFGLRRNVNVNVLGGVGVPVVNSFVAHPLAVQSFGVPTISSFGVQSFAVPSVQTFGVQSFGVPAVGVQTFSTGGCGTFFSSGY